MLITESTEKKASNKHHTKNILIFEKNHVSPAILKSKQRKKWVTNPFLKYCIDSENKFEKYMNQAQQMNLEQKAIFDIDYDHHNEKYEDYNILPVTRESRQKKIT